MLVVVVVVVIVVVFVVVDVVAALGASIIHDSSTWSVILTHLSLTLRHTALKLRQPGVVGVALRCSLDMACFRCFANAYNSDALARGLDSHEQHDVCCDTDHNQAEDKGRIGVSEFVFDHAFAVLIFEVYERHHQAELCQKGRHQL